MRTPKFQQALALCSLLAIPFAALADTVDSGRLLREQPKALPTLPGTPLQPMPSQSTEQQPAEAGATVLVKGFRIEGAKLIPADELERYIHGVVGKELTLAQLRAVAESLIAYYAQKGYLAQATLPPQDIENGIVRIEIMEGERGSLMINNTGKRAKNDRVQGFIDFRLGEGEAMSLQALSEAVNLLNEQPGVKAKTTLKPGAKTRRTDLIVSVADKPLATFSAAVNNNGSRGTGIAQAVAGVTLHNPTGAFDQASLLFTKTEGTEFGLGDYSFAAGNSGLRLGVSASRMLYEVTQDSMRAVDAHGSATTFGFNAQYPLYRRADYSLTLTGNLDTKKLHDFTVAGETGNRRVNSATLGINGIHQDGFGGGGATGFGLGLVVGKSDEDNRSAITADKSARDSLGSFGKLKYNLNRQQQINGTWMLAANLRGQFAFDNLDSSERFSLGGSDGVRAYPTGEAGGDDGWLLSLNLVHLFSNTLQGTLFLDAGGVRVNHDTWAGWNASDPTLKNRYTLKGAGFSLDWKLNDKFALNGILAAPIGDNPGRDANGNDSDARSMSVRGWVSLVGQF